MPEDKRIARIDALRDKLELEVGKLQALLFERITERLDKAYKDPEQLERIFQAFNKSEHQTLVTQFGNDLLKIGEFNSDYFQELTEMSTNAFTPIKRAV